MVKQFWGMKFPWRRQFLNGTSKMVTIIIYRNKNYKGDVDVYQNLHKMMSLMSEWKEFIKQQVALSPLITMDVAAMQKKELNVPDA